MKRRTIINVTISIYVISVLCMFPVVDWYIGKKNIRLRIEMSNKIDEVFERNKKHVVDIAYSNHNVTYDKTSIPKKNPFLTETGEWEEKYGDLVSLYRINYESGENGWSLYNISPDFFEYYDYDSRNQYVYTGVKQTWIFPYAVGYIKQNYSWGYNYLPPIKEAIEEALEFYTKNEKSSYHGDFQEGCIAEIWHQLYDCQNEYYYLKRRRGKEYDFLGEPLFESYGDSARKYSMQDGYMYNGFYKVFIGRTQPDVWEITKYAWNPDEEEKKSLWIYWSIGLTVLALCIVIPLLVVVYKRKKIKREGLYDRLIRLCNPSNYLKNYDKGKMDKANSLYQSLLGINPDDKVALTEIQSKAIKELGIKIIDKEELEDLIESVHPKHFMKPYNPEKLKIANELYSRLTRENLTYEEFEATEAEAEQLLE